MSDEPMSDEPVSEDPVPDDAVPDDAVQVVPRQGTAKMVLILVLVPTVVLVVLWALVRIASPPGVPTDEIIELTCDTSTEITVFSGSIEPDSLTSRDFESATIRVEFFAFLVREEGMQTVRPDEVDPETGRIHIEISQEIDGPANCEIISFIEEET